MSAESQSLVLLPAGGKGVITAVSAPAEQRGRLLELGLVPGTEVEVVRFAPLGDPVEIKVRGSHLSLRKHEAEQILVLPQG